MSLFKVSLSLKLYLKMEKEQQFYILRPDGTINFLNLAFYTALHRQDWQNNPENKEKIIGYEEKLPRPFKMADIEVLEVKFNVKLPMEFKEYIGKISREIFMFDYPVSINYEELEEAIRLNSEIRVKSDSFLTGEVNEKGFILIGKLENGERDYINLGGGRYFGSIWRRLEDSWSLYNVSFREYILKPFN